MPEPMRISSGSTPYALLIRLLAIVALLLSGEAVLGQSAPVQPQSGATSTSAGYATTIKISSGDLLDVQVFDTPELSGSKLRVSADGEIELPVLGPTIVGGLSTLQAGDAIAAKLRDAQIMLQPHVTVLVTEYSTQGVRVLGEVRTPGTYLLLGEHSLYDALSAAGGVTHEQGRSIAITHASDPANVEIVPVNTPNYSVRERLTVVRPGDVVVVSRADSIFVVGDVGHPGEYLIENGRQLTVLNAVALSQGLNPTAAASNASIVRPTADGGAVTIKIDIKQIAKNKAPNTILQPADVIVVPRSAFKEFLNYAIPNATSAVLGSVTAALVVR